MLYFLLPLFAFLDSLSWSLKLSLFRSTPGLSNFPLQCVKVKSESEVAQLCPTLSNPMDCSPPGPSVRGIFQVRVLEWGAIK